MSERQQLGMAQLVFEERSEWRWWVTPRPLVSKPIHRWYVFPHSFTSELVHALVDEWHLTANDHILDPFVGAGTTLLAAKERGIPATGYDLLPLAVLASEVKVADYDAGALRDAWLQLRRRIHQNSGGPPVKDYPGLVRRALPGKILGVCDAIDRAIQVMEAREIERSFFRLGLLATVREHSRAIANGGWLRWVERRGSEKDVLADFTSRIELMIGDVEAVGARCGSFWRVGEADARSVPDAEGTYTAVITSPPYLNRHDYTRVFGVELMFGFLGWEHTRKLRYQSFHSHPEARPIRPDSDGYVRPRGLERTISEIRRAVKDSRVSKMIDGYFTDMYLVLHEMRRVSRPGARVALVLGNVQYAGVPVPVDEFTGRIAEQVGFIVEKVTVTRCRNNSAQQMGVYGRRPSRESVVLLRNR